MRGTFLFLSWTMARAMRAMKKLKKIIKKERRRRACVGGLDVRNKIKEEERALNSSNNKKKKKGTAYFLFGRFNLLD